MESTILTLKSVDLFGNKVCFELPGTPPDSDTGPAVAVKRNPQLLTILDRRYLLLFFLKHHIFKAFRMAEHRQVDSTLTVKILVQFCQMIIHLWKLHAGIRCQHYINRHSAFNHQKQHSGTVLSTRQADGMKNLLAK